MTGLECLKAELKKRGCTTAQTNSKCIPIVLDIICQSGDGYREQAKLIDERDKLRAEIAYLKGWEAQYRREMADEEKYIQKRLGEAQAYIDSFYKAIEECETDDGRDALRLAQMFVNTVTVGTVYDNTAFIIGLAGILSGNKVAPMGELKKINKKLFTKEIIP